VPLIASLPEIAVIVGADPNARGKALDRHSRTQSEGAGIVYADLIVTTPDRLGQQLLGRLETLRTSRSASTSITRRNGWHSTS
jgi:hypothetical protein